MKFSKRIVILILLLVVAVLATACQAGISGYEVVREDFTVPSGGFIRETANCPVGKVVLGGGAQVVGEGTGNFRTLIRESAGGTVVIGGDTVHVWMVALENGSKDSHTIGIFAICANAQ
jgi:hypothetical protein